ncbi:MAG: tRNA uridine-5-carboxymethylaminomethyl(34) synthesis GTPase MnmE [Rhizobiaceae bacterium]
MNESVGDTIYALASGHPPSGIAVIRISGPRCRFVCEMMCGGVPDARCAVLREIRSAQNIVIDRGLVLYFPGPASFTGEEVVELHLHGGRAVVAAVCDALESIEGLRSAEAGEFTLRAFQSGKIDLTGAEALADLIEAQTEEQRRFALANYGDAHRVLYEGWRSGIVKCLAEMTALIDFADEADVMETADLGTLRELRILVGEIDSHMKRFRAGEIIREGYRIAIVGAPNAGKSSLLNALAGREIAIVTEEPGTTRDVLEVALDIGGYKVVLSDTAGIRDGAGTVEAIGIARAKQAAEAADLVLVLEDASGGKADMPALDMAGPILRVGNKIDLDPEHDRRRYDICISVKEQRGMDALIERLGREAVQAGAVTSIVPFRRRHLALLREARDALGLVVAGELTAVELRAEELRRAADSIGRLTGSVDVEDLLDVVFSRFCIGK